VGWGMASGVWEALQMPTAARIVLTANGHAEVACSFSDIGTGTGAFASRWLVPRLSLWREEHSDIALSIIGVDRVVKLDADEADLAIRYARSTPRGGSREIFRDRFYPVCSPKLLAKGPTIRHASDLGGYPLIHFDWFANDATAPNWSRWFEMASVSDPRARNGCQIALSFREELHAIEAVLAGQGIALCSDVVVADDLASGALVKALDLALPGYGYCPVYAPNHPRRAIIEVFVRWISTVAGREMVKRAGRSNITRGKE
jgi:LysR family transcriptional regulator, glycine cleavage system transcriptional activator